MYKNNLMQALQQVEEEMKRYRPAKNYLEGLPPLDLRSFEVNNFVFEFMLF